MPTAPIPSDPTALLAEAERIERDAVALSRSFPRAVGRTLHLAARAGAVYPRAANLNGAITRAGMARRVALIASAVPLDVADPMWRALLGAEPVDGRVTRGRSPKWKARRAYHGDPHGVGGGSWASSIARAVSAGPPSAGGGLLACGLGGTLNRSSHKS